jgi:hypothetical protein
MRFLERVLLTLGLATAASMATGAETPLKPGAPLPEARREPEAPGSVRQLEWLDLLPADARAGASLTPPAPIHDYLSGEGGPAVAQSEVYAVNPELDGKRVRLPGFIVPLEIDERGRVTELFLVPYFGACIHVPPPPPNQIVHVTLQEGMSVESIYAAFWITGRMKVAKKSTRLGASAYTIAAETVENYEF